MSPITNAKRMCTLTVGIVALTTLTACSTGSREVTESAPASSVAAMPPVANFIADMPAGGDTGMTTMAITVKGDDVIAYATNGLNDEAYFLGTQKDGRLDLTSMFADHLTASYDGTNVDGELVMNEVGAAPAKFTASRVEAPAGMYTAAHGGSRATWVVRPDRTVVGVMNNSAPGDHKVTDAIAAQDKEFRDRVREMRLNQQMQQAPRMAVGAWTAEMGGAKVVAVPVTGDMDL